MRYNYLSCVTDLSPISTIIPTLLPFKLIFFFFNDTATTEIYTLSLHDALPIFRLAALRRQRRPGTRAAVVRSVAANLNPRSEEHTSELQSRRDLVCRLLLEKKKKTYSESILRLELGTKTRRFLRLSQHVLQSYI